MSLLIYAAHIKKNFQWIFGVGDGGGGGLLLVHSEL